MKILMISLLSLALISCSLISPKKTIIGSILVHAGASFPAELLDFSPTEKFRVYWQGALSIFAHTLVYHTNEHNEITDAMVISLNEKTELRDTLFLDNLSIVKEVANMLDTIPSSRPRKEFAGRDDGVAVFFARNDSDQGFYYVQYCSYDEFQECADLENLLLKIEKAIDLEDLLLKTSATF